MIDIDRSRRSTTRDKKRGVVRLPPSVTEFLPFFNLSISNHDYYMITQKQDEQHAGTSNAITLVFLNQSSVKKRSWSRGWDLNPGKAILQTAASASPPPRLFYDYLGCVLVVESSDSRFSTIHASMRGTTSMLLKHFFKCLIRIANSIPPRHHQIHNDRDKSCFCKIPCRINSLRRRGGQPYPRLALRISAMIRSVISLSTVLSFAS